MVENSKEKKRNCSLQEISPFHTVFLKDLYCRHEGLVLEGVKLSPLGYFMFIFVAVLAKGQWAIVMALCQFCVCPCMHDFRLEACLI